MNNLSEASQAYIKDTACKVVLELLCRIAKTATTNNDDISNVLIELTARVFVSTIYAELATNLNLSVSTTDTGTAKRVTDKIIELTTDMLKQELGQ